MTAIAILEIKRRGAEQGVAPELLFFSDEQALKERVDKLITLDNVERLQVYRLAQTLHRQVSFPSL